MTPFRGRPEFPALVAAVRAGDCHPGIFCDWLEEFGATAADVCTLYALPKPLHVLRHEGGPGASYSYAVPPAKDDSLRPVLAAWADRHGPPGRAADVRADPVRGPSVGGRWFVVRDRDEIDGRDFGFAAEPAARRELKRRVLGLFADVRVPCPACDGTGAVRGHWPDGEETGPLPCARCGKGGPNSPGTVAPADLIPPEPDARALLTHLDVPNELLDRRADIFAAITRGIEGFNRGLPDTLLGQPVVLPDVGPTGPTTAMSLRRRTMTRGVRR